MNASTTSSAAGPVSYYRFKPWNIGRFVIWSLFAIALIVAPMLFRSSLALTMLSQIGYLIIICLSYNMLLGQGGMLSFGHAVYTGLGSFIAIHAMNMATKGSAGIPLVLIPLVGGLAGAFFAILLGFVTTKKSGTTFAMITLGIGELVFAMSLMPMNGWPTTRLPDTPASPPKNSGTISDIANTSSPMPSVIMAKVVPARLVVT